MEQQRPLPRVRQILVALAFTLTGTAIALAAVEILVRLGFTLPAHQIVRRNNLRKVNGTVVWDLKTPRENLSCVEEHPERQRILFFGNSITFGGQVRPEETFTALLEKKLNEDRPNPGFCVMNFAQEAFRYKQRQALAIEKIPQYRPTIALLQDWYSEWGGEACLKSDYYLFGDSAFFFSPYSLGPDGFPGPTSALNRWLFQHSYVYQYLVIASQPLPRREPSGDCSAQADIALHEKALLDFTNLAREYGAKPATFFVPNLSYPLNQRRQEEIDHEDPIVEFGREHDFPVFVLRKEMTDLDNVAIRFDSWHFSAAGHKVVAAILEPHVLQLLDKPAPAQAGNR